MAVAVARAVEELSWPEVASMSEAGGADAKVTLGVSVRDCAVEAAWSKDPWHSDTSDVVRVSAVSGGRSRGWSHAQKARRSGDTLPQEPPVPVDFDFGALVRRAVVQSGTRIPPRF